MPVAKKGKRKKKSAKKKGLKGLQTIADLLKSVRQQYELKSKDFNSYPHSDVKKLINQYADNNTLLAKVRIDCDCVLIDFCVSCFGFCFFCCCCCCFFFHL